MHAVIHHTLFFRLNQECWRVVVVDTSQHLLTGKDTFPYPVICRATHAQAGLIGIKTQVTTIALATVRQHVHRKRQRPPASRPDGIAFPNALMALSPVENMAYHPVRKAHDDAIHRRGERNGVALVSVAL